MKQPKLKKGDLVVVAFTDHAEDMGALEFRVAGWVKSVSRTVLEVISWDYVDDRERRGEDVNLKWFSIVRKAIRSIKIIEIQPEVK